MRQNARLFSLALFTFFFAVAVLGGLFWANMNLVRAFQGGEKFILGWKSTRNFIVQGISPYSDINTLDVQREIYNRAARPGEEQYRYAEPLYFILLNIPIASITDRRAALALWMIFLQASTAGTLFLSLQLSKWRPGWLYLILLVIFSYSWLPGAIAFQRASALPIQMLILLSALRAAEVDLDELAGALLLLAALNIEAFGLVILLVLFWAASARRWRILTGFTMLFIFLAISALVVLPAWPLQFVRAAYQNLTNTAQPSLPLVFAAWFPALGNRLAQLVIGIIGAVVLLEWYAVRNRHIYWLYWTISLTLVATPLLGLPVSPENQGIYLPAFILIISVMEQRWQTFGRWLAIILLLLVWAGLWLISYQPGGSLQMNLLTLPVVFFIILYWIRWWVARPPRLWADTVPRIR